ncbi:hypothetical protein [Flagellimonas sp.]|uniref:hypothetical protein n=1 Tax=Flagellimonas sp. TaxID=2058762 RepID=UPI003B5B0A86
MKAVKVQYTVQEHYIEENKRNIQKVMQALKDNPIEGMLYSSYTDQENPNTFIHINMAADNETMAKLNNVPEFISFRMALKASQPKSPPKQTTLDIVSASFEIA